MIKQVYENRSQSVLVKVHPVSSIVEYLITDGYIEDDFNVDAMYDAYNNDEMDDYWKSVGKLTDSIIDLLNDKIEQKEDNIIEAIENNEPYDDEYWEKQESMSDMDKWMWILDEQGFVREYVTIRDVTGHPNPYNL